MINTRQIELGTLQVGPEFYCTWRNITTGVTTSVHQGLLKTGIHTLQQYGTRMFAHTAFAYFGCLAPGRGIGGTNMCNSTVGKFP